MPVKAFRDAKVRLAPALAPDERASLARRMGATVLAAAEPLPVAVVCDDCGVAEWARALGALVIWAPGRGLNGAVAAGVDHLARAGVEHVTVAHGDLPMASDLAWPSRFRGVTAVPDRRHDGTNVLGLPARSGLRFSYGPGSLRRHVAGAFRLGLAVRVVDEPLLAWDVDVPDDLDQLGSVTPSSPVSSSGSVGPGARRR